MKNQDWSKLEGKKVIMFDVDPDELVTIGQIVGCDPDIGICIAEVGDVDPWFVVHGPASPRLKNRSSDFKHTRSIELDFIYNMLISGYYSGHQDKENEKKLWGKIGNNFSTPCPFTM